MHFICIYKRQMQSKRLLKLQIAGIMQYIAEIDSRALISSYRNLITHSNRYKTVHENTFEILMESFQMRKVHIYGRVSAVSNLF
jgi:hypothetical protein